MTLMLPLDRVGQVAKKSKVKSTLHPIRSFLTENNMTQAHHLFSAVNSQYCLTLPQPTHLGAAVVVAKHSNLLSLCPRLLC